MQTLMPTPSVEDAPGELAALLVQSDLIALALVRDGAVVFANAAFHHLFGGAGGLSGEPFLDLVAPSHRERAAILLRIRDETQATAVVEAAPGRGGREVELHACALNPGGAQVCAIFAQDVTVRRRDAARLNLLAFSDPLTGLANRAQFADRLRAAAVAARRDGAGFAVLMLDLDGFKPVNDRHGHGVGDCVLQHVAQRLAAGVRSGDAVARLGGDEFAVLLPMLSRRSDIAGIAARLLHALRQPITVGTLCLHVAASAGVAVFPEHGDAVERLLIAADTALYAAKRGRAGHFVWASAAADAALRPTAMAWSMAHELGVAEMDHQHAGLAALLNAFAAALQDGGDPGAPFAAFMQYAAKHFGCEERLMADSRYPGAARHRDQHKRLLADAAGLAPEVANGSPSLILRYLEAWLFRHVDGADRELAQFLLAASAAPQEERPEAPPPHHERLGAAPRTHHAVHIDAPHARHEGHGDAAPCACAARDAEATVITSAPT
jgi:diguanylate cyclase (GGDEF)-like protein/hemerythrin-like metal-binding protein